MPKSTSSIKRCKPRKPDGFPLTPNGNGQWSKVIRGKTHYFGVWEDPDAALNLYLDQKDDLLAGRTPRTKGLSVRDLANLYLEEQEEKVQEGAIRQRTFEDCKRHCTFIVSHIGHLAAEAVGPQDFTLLRRKFPKTWGLAMREKHIKQTRTIFNFGYDQEHIEKLPRFGAQFRPPTKSDKRKAGTRVRPFKPEEIRAVLHHLMDRPRHRQLRAMVLLGINGGFGNTDLGRLKETDVEDGWIRTKRAKIGVERACPLWPETLLAIDECVANRRQVHEDGYLFVTKHGNPWHNEKTKSPVSQAFSRVAKQLDIDATFYCLRHTLQTVCDQSQVPRYVTQQIMGHADGTMSGHYSHGLLDGQLRDAVNKVHAWLFPAKQGRSAGWTIKTHRVRT